MQNIIVSFLGSFFIKALWLNHQCHSVMVQKFDGKS